MEAADFDAYLSPDENAKIEAEFTALQRPVRDASTRASATSAGPRAGPSGGGKPVSGGFAEAGAAPPWALLLVTVALVGWSAVFALFQYTGRSGELAATAGPLAPGARNLGRSTGFSRRRR